MLIIPLLASEYTDPSNLPVFRNILRYLGRVPYLSHIIFGLDRATEEETFQLRDLLKAAELKNYLIQWNDGPGFGSIYNKLNRVSKSFRPLGSKNALKMYTNSPVKFKDFLIAKGKDLPSSVSL